MKTIYDFGVPFSDRAKNPGGLFANQLYGIAKRDMWKGMVAFDRPTRIPQAPSRHRSMTLPVHEFLDRLRTRAGEGLHMARAYGLYGAARKGQRGICG